jgi:hypothetical protein
MKIYFDDPEYDGQFLRTLEYGPLGAQIGEAWAIAAQIRAGDAASWYNAWSSYADRLYDLAVKSHAAGHRVSACNAFLRASNYYRTAYIFMFALPIDPRVIEAYEKQTDSFQKAAALLYAHFPDLCRLLFQLCRLLVEHIRGKRESPLQFQAPFFDCLLRSDSILFQ